MTALGSAITADREDIFRLLLTAGDSFSVSPLCYLSGDSVSGCNPRIRYRGTVKNSLMHWAAFTNSQKCLLVLLQRRSMRADVRNSQGTTPLHVAAMKGHIALMKILMDFGADPSTYTSEGDNVLHLSLMEGRGEVVKFLLERRFVPRLNVNSENKNGASPLSIAAEKSDIDSIDLLIKAGAHAHKTNKKSRSPLHYAAKNGNVKVARTLMKPLTQEQRVELINRKTSEGYTALHIATGQQHVDFVKYDLLSLCQKCTQHGGWYLCRYLMERGADPNTIGPNGRSSFHIAVEKKCCRMFTLFCTHGADLSQLTASGESITHIAAAAGANGNSHRRQTDRHVSS